MMSMVMVASLFAGCGTDSGKENSASDNSKTEETVQTTSDDPYAAYAGTTISVHKIFFFIVTSHFCYFLL